MKLYFAAAGALLLGTSAMAWAPAETMDSKWVEAGSKVSLLSPKRTPNDQMKVAVLEEETAVVVLAQPRAGVQGLQPGEGLAAGPAWVCTMGASIAPSGL